MVTANTAHSSLDGYKALNLLYPACHHTCIQSSIYCLLLIFTTGSPSPDVSPLPGRQLAKTVFAGSYNNDTILTQSVTPGTWDTHQLYRSFTLTSLGKITSFFHHLEVSDALPKLSRWKDINCLRVKFSTAAIINLSS